MRRYYFHLHQGPRTLLDRTGLLLPDLASAMHEAREAARIGADLAACDQSGWRIEVADDRGVRLITYHFPERRRTNPPPKGRTTERPRAGWNRIWLPLRLLAFLLVGRGWRRRVPRPIPGARPQGGEASAQRPEPGRQG